MKEHVCSREMWDKGLRYTKRNTGGGELNKLWLYVKLTDNDELYDVEGKDINLAIWTVTGSDIFRRSTCGDRAKKTPLVWGKKLPPRIRSPTVLSNARSQSKWERLVYMFLGCITYNTIGIIIPGDWNLNSTKYIELLDYMKTGREKNETYFIESIYMNSWNNHIEIGA